MIKKVSKLLVRRLKNKMELTGQMKNSRELLDEALEFHTKTLLLDEDENTDGASGHAIDEVREALGKL
jgi:hypothetical protein